MEIAIVTENVALVVVEFLDSLLRTLEEHNCKRKREIVV